ncbi:MAG TPA: preprotein translocase subunit SecE [Firmicutes bacterium]|nr:preprotein translocase subunit SecE [Bacillota bacterium]
MSLTKQELKKVSWPSIKDILKYTGATIVFVLILAGFFSLLNLGLSFVKGLFI